MTNMNNEKIKFTKKDINTGNDKLLECETIFIPAT